MIKWAALGVFAAAAAGAYVFYGEALLNPPAPAVAEAPEARMRQADECEAQDARYALRGDSGLVLTFEALPAGAAISGLGGVADYASLTDLVYVVATPDGETRRFVAMDAVDFPIHLLFPQAPSGGPQPTRGLDLIQIATFDRDYDYVSGLPRHGTQAPARIFAPGLTRHLARDGYGGAIGFFDFQSCGNDAEAVKSAALSLAP